MDIQGLVQKKLEDCDLANPEVVQRTGWLDDVEDEILESIYREYIDLASSKSHSISLLLGKPNYTSNSCDFFAGWYPETFCAYGWLVDEKLLFVAAEHHDRETPVALIVNALTIDQINALRA